MQPGPGTMNDELFGGENPLIGSGSGTSKKQWNLWREVVKEGHINWL